VACINASELSVEINVNSERGPVQFRLDLDLERFSHQCIHNQLKSGVLYEQELSSFLLRALRPGDVFIDVGAHIGYFSMLAAKLVRPTGAVFSFEPEPDNFARLTRHARENDLPHVQAFNMPVAAQPGEIEFFVNADNDGGHALWDPGRHPFNQRSRAEVTRKRLCAASLDRFEVLQTRPARAIKIDTEGAEHQVLLGARRWLEERRTLFLVVEINTFGLDQMGSSQLALRGFAAKFGYSTFLLDPEGYRPRLVRPDHIISANTSKSNEVFNVLLSTPEAVASVFPR
jgi:FkbM family methyltransferase